jgi:DNA repair exonuclease SbcCD ATPase subunit
MKKEDKWQDSFREASEEVGFWRKKHPKATFSEIKNSVDGKLAKIRADMIQDLIEESELHDFKTLPKGSRPKCPVCGKTLASNGRQSRELVTTHEQIVEVERSKGYCKTCKVSYFPPG